MLHFLLMTFDMCGKLIVLKPQKTAEFLLRFLLFNTQVRVKFTFKLLNCSAIYFNNHV